MRPYLVFCSVGSKGPTGDLFGLHREFDVAFHNYDSGATVVPRTREAEYYWLRPGAEKLNVAAALLPGILGGYKQIAILDDDLALTTDDLNRLFRVGGALRLPLYQPALTLGSFCSHKHLFQSKRSLAEPVRQVPFVEIMCPFFSRAALMDCLPTFDINESGWGLDCFLWPKAVGGECYVVDGILVGHYRMPVRRDRTLRNGLTPMQELWIQQVCDNPETAPFWPPGVCRTTGTWPYGLGSEI